jgi:hypothetical protein
MQIGNTRLSRVKRKYNSTQRCQSTGNMYYATKGNLDFTVCLEICREHYGKLTANIKHMGNQRRNTRLNKAHGKSDKSSWQ